MVSSSVSISGLPHSATSRKRGKVSPGRRDLELTKQKESAELPNLCFSRRQFESYETRRPQTKPGSKYMERPRGAVKNRPHRSNSANCQVKQLKKKKKIFFELLPPTFFYLFQNDVLSDYIYSPMAKMKKVLRLHF